MYWLRCERTGERFASAHLQYNLANVWSSHRYSITFFSAWIVTYSLHYRSFSIELGKKGKMSQRQQWQVNLIRWFLFHLLLCCIVLGPCCIFSRTRFSSVAHFLLHVADFLYWLAFLGRFCLCVNYVNLLSSWCAQFTSQVSVFICFALLLCVLCVMWECSFFSARPRRSYWNTQSGHTGYFSPIYSMGIRSVFSCRAAIVRCVHPFDCWIILWCVAYLVIGCCSFPPFFQHSGSVASLYPFAEAIFLRDERQH